MTSKRTERKNTQHVAIIKEHWPELVDANWNRHLKKGFTTIPRTLCLIATIADTLKKKNKSVSACYVGLWCRTWDTGLVEIANEHEMALESGFTGERKVYTWRDRMKELVALGFIKIAEGPKGPYQYVFIVNPYNVIATLRETGKIKSHYWQAITQRANEIGADDITQYLKKKIVEEKLEKLKLTSKPAKRASKKKSKASL